jgi:hypothetical protein
MIVASIANHAVVRLLDYRVFFARVLRPVLGYGWDSPLRAGDSPPSA